MALSTQYANEFASFRHGMTTDTSTARDTSVRPDWGPSEARIVPIGATIISRSFRLFTRLSSSNSRFWYNAHPWNLPSVGPRVDWRIVGLGGIVSPKPLPALSYFNRLVRAAR